MLFKSSRGLYEGDVCMDQGSPKGSLPPAAKQVGEKRPWASPGLKRLDVGLTATHTARHSTPDGSSSRS